MTRIEVEGALPAGLRALGVREIILLEMREFSEMFCAERIFKAAVEGCEGLEYFGEFALRAGFTQQTGLKCENPTIVLARLFAGLPNGIEGRL